jgi:membrane protease YdiL (CAAX protease family)
VIATLGWSAPIVVVLFTVVMALGLAAPLDRKKRGRAVSSITTAVVFGAGLMVFLGGRLLAGGHSPAPASGLLIGLNTLAAVAEEALFRRAAFAALLPAGPACAIAGSALLFGLAHVTVYGWWAFPVDAGAGIVLGWQRWASGSWTIPAVTHALADLLVVI